MLPAMTGNGQTIANRFYVLPWPGRTIQQSNFKNGSIARKVSEATNQGKGQAAALAVLLKIDVPDYARSTGKHNCFSGKSPHPGSVPTGL